MSNQSLAIQQAALGGLKAQLTTFKEQLLVEMSRYQRIVENLRSEGLSYEVYSTYKNQYFAYDLYRIRNLIQHIDSHDLPYIHKNLEETQANIETASQSFDF